MKNTKLVEEAKLNPARIYHRPHDVLRDRRLKDPDRLEILAAWERNMRASAVEGSDEASSEGLLEVEKAQREIEQRLQ